MAVAVKLYQCLLAQYVAFPNDTAALAPIALRLRAAGRSVAVRQPLAPGGEKGLEQGSAFARQDSGGHLDAMI